MIQIYHNKIKIKNHTIKTMSTPKLLSFNDIVNASWQDLGNKTFTNSMTNTFLGHVYAKYDNMWSLSAMCTNGRIEFAHNNSTIALFGEDFDVTVPIFLENIILA